MKQRHATLAAAISLCASLSSTGVLAAEKNTYAYEGISLTRNSAPDACKSLNKVVDLTTYGCDDKSMQWKIFGGMRLNRYTGFEITYADLGRSSIGGTADVGKVTLKSRASGFGLSAVGYLPMDDKFALFAKAGAFRWRVKASIDTPVGGAEDRESGVSFAGGLGASYFFTDELGVRAEYEVIKGVGDKGEWSGSDVHVMSVGVTLRF